MKKERQRTLLVGAALLLAGATASARGSMVSPTAESDSRAAAVEQSAPQQQKDNKRTVSGQILDTNGEPLTGAIVRVEGTDKAAVTDTDGRFTLQGVAQNQYITVSYLGKKAVRKRATGDRLSIALDDDDNTLGDVLVTGYQTISKERATGAYDMIKGSDLEKPAANISERIVGRVAGVRTDLDADGNVSMVVRGQGTFLSADPLIVIDGFATNEGLSSINPNDVETVTVLKDAAASSIWGARASNGVIVITTKQAARNNKLKVEFNSFVRIGSKTDLDYLRNLASSEEQVAWEKATAGKYGYNTLPSSGSWNTFKNSFQQAYTLGYTLYNRMMSGDLTEAQYNSEMDKLAKLDNSKQIEDNLLRRPTYQNYNLSLAGGTERTQNYVSVNYQYDSSRFKKTHDDKLQINYRGNYNVFKWLDASLSTMVSYGNGTYNGSSVSEIKALGPYDMLIDDSGNLTDLMRLKYYQPLIDNTLDKSSFPYSDWSYNPIREISSRDITSKTLGTRIQAGLTFKIIDGLTLDTKLQYERYEQSNRSLYYEDSWTVRNTVNTTSAYDPETGKVTANLPTGQFLDESTSTQTSYDWRTQLNFSKTFLRDHRVDFIAGFEMMQDKTTSHSSPRSVGYDDDHLTVGIFPNGTGDSNNPLYNMVGSKITFQSGSYINRYSWYNNRYISYYANLAYTFKERYSVSGSIRNDASNFITDDPEYRYSPFWSIGGSWVASKEDFMKDITWVDYLKLRMTYGYNGNSNNASSVKPLISMGQTDAVTGLTQASIYDKGNPNLRWERTSTFNVGVDFDLLSHHLYGKIDYYYKYGKDILANVAIPYVDGDDTAYFNNAEITNHGIELTLGSQFAITPELRWNGQLTFSYNKNKVKKLLVANANHWWLSGSGYSGELYIEGKSIGSLWSYAYGGMKDVGTAGNERIEPVIKLVGDEVTPLSNPSINYDGREFMVCSGTQNAPTSIGFTNEFSWRFIDLSFTITGQMGHKFRQTPFNYTTQSTFANAQISSVLGSDGSTVVPIPLYTSDNMYSSTYTGYMDYLIASADNFRLRELNLTLNAPAPLARKIGLTAAQFYIQGNNLLTLKGQDEDPDYAYGSLRLQPSWTFGVKVTF